MAKQKKGVMPPALKRYWASRRKSKAVKSKAHRKHATPKRRKKNPVSMFRLAIKKGGQTLYLRATGDKFSKSGPFKRYATPSGAKGAAQSLASRYASLKGWTFYAVT